MTKFKSAVKSAILGIVFSVVALLGGCATTSGTSADLVVVPTPIVQKCEAAKTENRPKRPTLSQLEEVSTLSTNADTVRAYLDATYSLIGYSKALENNLDACK